MKIGFFDFCGFWYDHGLVEQKSMGGTQGLATTLAYYLARTGLKVTLHTAGDHAYTLDGVSYLGLNYRPDPMDVAVVVGPVSPKFLAQLKSGLSARRLVLWWHANQLTRDMSAWIAKEFDDVVVVSKYAFDKNADRLPAHKLHLIRNFLPVLPDLLREHESLIPQAEKEHGCLAYVGNWTRGLDHVPEVASRLRERNVAFKIRIFSGIGVYEPHKSDVSNEPEFIRRCRTDPNIDVVRRVGKRELFSQLRDVSILLMPNTFEESFCLSLIEAMYMELICVATNRAAIPETAGGFAYLGPVLVPDSDEPHSPLDMDKYVDLLCKVMGDVSACSERLPEQKRYVIDSFSPDAAARTWQRFFETTVRS